MKKSQIKMAETVSVLVIFILVTFIGFIFYSNYEQTQLRRIENRFSEYASLETVQLITYLPELRCPTTEMSRGCIDLLKLKSFINKSDEGQEEFLLDYIDTLGNSRIQLKTHYPNNYSFLVFDNLQEDAPRIDTTFVHVSLYDPLNSTYNYGVLEVEHASN